MPAAVPGTRHYTPVAETFNDTEAPGSDKTSVTTQNQPDKKREHVESVPERQSTARRMRRNFEYIQKQSSPGSQEISGTAQMRRIFPNYEAESVTRESHLAPFPGAPASPDPTTRAMVRRNSIESIASGLDSIFDRMGERIPAQTLERLAKVVEQRVKFKKGQGPVAALAKQSGLTRSLAMPTHLAMVLQLAFTDPEMLKIAKMGIRVALSNPDTGGVPPEGFKPLYDLLQKWGYNRQGVLKDTEKFHQRLEFMAQRKDSMEQFRQFSLEVEARLPEKPAHIKENDLKADAEREKSILALLADYFMRPVASKNMGQEQMRCTVNNGHSRFRPQSAVC